MKRVLFVCTGNTCRSPMAEALFNRSSPPGWRAESAGLAAGGNLSAPASAALRECGVVLENRPARQLTEAMLAQFDAVVCMTESHRQVLLRAGVPAEKLCVLSGGIPDPFGGDLEDYRACRDAILAALPELMRRLENAG